ncbi:MAG: GNAT family N-acetyltransferase [Defluviitaleaceae bacterium]|nr:GNAT family N-acetyltransferase [Defluviitaleaceae bacterium]
MDVNYRKVTKTDYNKCADVLVTAYNGEPWNNTWTREEAFLRIEATMSGFNSRGYVAEIDGEVVAMCLGRIDYYYSNWNQFCVDEFNVLSNFQGKGIGSRLMNFVSNLMKQDGIDRIFLITGGKSAAEFYGKNGFEKSDDGTMMTLGLQT